VSFDTRGADTRGSGRGIGIPSRPAERTHSTISQKSWLALTVPDAFPAKSYTTEILIDTTQRSTSITL